MRQIVGFKTSERRAPKTGVACRVCGKTGTSNFPVIKGVHEACDKAKKGR